MGEGFSLATVLVGVAAGVGCMLFYRRYFPAGKTSETVSPRFLLYPFYLIGRMYLSSLDVIKMILTGAKIDVVEVDSKLSNEFLRLILSISITLTPGSILLEMSEDRLAILRLRGKNEPDAPGADDPMKVKIENRLLKAQGKGGGACTYCG